MTIRPNIDFTCQDGSEENHQVAPGANVVNLILSALNPDTFYREEGLIRHLSTVSPDPRKTLEEAVAQGWLQYRAGDGYYYDSTCWIPRREKTETQKRLVDSVEVDEHEHPADCDQVAKSNPVFFSYFKKPLWNVDPYNTITPAQLHTVITDPRYFKGRTQTLRSIKTKAKRDKYKVKNLDYVTPAGVFHHRKDNQLLKRSGIMVLDHDRVPDPVALRDTLISDEGITTVLAFISPSGDGLKQFVEIDLSCDHFTNFKAFSNYLKHTRQLTIDQSGKDISRACFVCHDPTCYLNSNYAL